MKNAILFLILILPCLAFAQKDTVISYSGVVEVPGATKEQLYTRARQWFNSTFISSKDVLQISDKETGELAGKGIMHATAVYKYMGTQRAPVEANFVCDVWVKDEKYKYELTNFDAAFDTKEGDRSLELGVLTTADETTAKFPMVGKKTMNEMFRAAKIAVEEKSQELILSLKTAMSKPSKDDF
jgi:hypothetical protein